MIISYNLPISSQGIFSDTCKTYTNSVRNNQFTVDYTTQNVCRIVGFNMDAYMYVHGYAIQVS